MKQRFLYRGKLYSVELSAQGTGYWVQIDSKNHQISEVDIREGDINFVSGLVKHSAVWVKRGRELWVHVTGKSYHFVKAVGSQAASAAASAERILRAPMPGQVREVFAQDGIQVGPGEVLLLLEAMKMEIRIQAPFAARVARVAVKQGQSVEKEQILVELEAE